MDKFIAVLKLLIALGVHLFINHMDIVDLQWCRELRSIGIFIK